MGSSSSATPSYSSASSSSSSSLSSPENTLHKAQQLPRLAVQPPPAPAAASTTIGRFQVMVNTDSKAEQETAAPGRPHGTAPDRKSPSPSQPTTTCNYYISSDNDSEPEDEAFKREITQLRERSVSQGSSPSYLQHCNQPITHRVISSEACGFECSSNY